MYIYLSLIYQQLLISNSTDRMPNIVDPDQTLEQSDLGLHCLPRSNCQSKNLGLLMCYCHLYSQHYPLDTWKDYAAEDKNNFEVLLHVHLTRVLF